MADVAIPPSASSSVPAASSLRQSLDAHNAAFESLLRLIPAKLYLVNDVEDQVYDSKYQKNKRKKNEAKQAIKEASKKAKRQKLDPANAKTVLEIQAERAATKAKSKEDQGDDEDDEDDGTGSEGGDFNIALVGVMNGAGDEEGDEQGDGRGPPARRLKNESIADVRARLHQKIASLRANRGRGGATASAGGADGEGATSTTKDDLLEERRRKRGEMRDRRRRERKQERKQAKKGKEQAMALKEDPGAKSKGTEREKDKETRGNTKAPALLVSDKTTSKPSSSVHDVSTDASGLSFSTVDFGSGKKKKKVDAKSALAALTAKKEKLASMDSDERTKVEEKDRWGKALASASGEKVKDDEVLLKKSIKKKEKSKEKSRKAWTDREEHQREMEAARQKKRTENLATKKDRAKRGGKTGGAKGGGKKNKARPGFEGKFGGGSVKGNKGKAKPGAGKKG